MPPSSSRHTISPTMEVYLHGPTSQNFHFRTCGTNISILVILYVRTSFLRPPTLDWCLCWTWFYLSACIELKKIKHADVTSAPSLIACAVVTFKRRYVDDLIFSHIVGHSWLPFTSAINRISQLKSFGASSVNPSFGASFLPTVCWPGFEHTKFARAAHSSHYHVGKAPKTSSAVSDIQFSTIFTFIIRSNSTTKEN